MTAVRLENISKRFGETPALSNITLDIAAGELFFLLGPSGCGKSTLLRLIAGLHAPTAGRILFNDRDVTGLGTERRNAVMCFQSYALWPHMSVYENVRFGLGVRNVPPAQQRERAESVLRLVRMSEYASRKPNQLSGGQQQRVALARALAVQPDCLLLDEPLSNLDAKLRLEMRAEIRRICKTAGFTTIYVTHDQKEALSVADRIAILKDGKLVQVGTPGELYLRPRTSFVADFVGQTNLLPGKVVGGGEGTLRIETAAGQIHAAGNGKVEGNVVLSIRPERMRIAPSQGSGVADQVGSNGHNRLVGRVKETTFLGEASEHVLRVNGLELKVVSTPPLLTTPEEMAVEFDPADVVVLPE
jgi:iron(III) transport system ATP-binding protein